MGGTPTLGIGELGQRTYGKYWIYVPTDLAEDKAFPFKAGDKLLITITDGKRVYLEGA